MIVLKREHVSDMLKNAWNGTIERTDDMVDEDARLQRLSTRLSGGEAVVPARGRRRWDFGSLGGGVNETLGV